MPTEKKSVHVVVAPEVYDRFAEIAQSDHMTPTGYAALVLSKLSDLKPGHALDAIASIPKDFFRARRGRPPSTASDADKGTESTLEQVR